MGHKLLTMLITYLFGIVGCISIANADGDITPTPYRPTISNPAELPAPGWLELELGGLDDRMAKRQSLPFLAKVAFDENWGILLAGDAWIRDYLGSTTSGTGDVSLTLKHRIPTNDKNQNFGIEGGIKFPTAQHGLGSGESDFTINGIYSLDFASDWRLDANGSATRLGTTDPGTSSFSYLWALALSKGLGNWTLAAEISSTHHSGLPNTTQWLAAASYAIHPRVVLDAGFSVLQQNNEDGHTLFFGATWLADKLF
jgi:hypothetical protein